MFLTIAQDPPFVPNTEAKVSNLYKKASHRFLGARPLLGVWGAPGGDMCRPRALLWEKLGDYGSRGLLMFQQT